MGIEEIDELDRAYHEKCDNVSFGYYCLEQGDTCWYPGCRKKVYSYGLCSTHFQRFRRGKLIVLDMGEYGNGEAADLVLEFTEIASRKGVSPEELLTMAFMTAIELGRE